MSDHDFVKFVRHHKALLVYIAIMVTISLLLELTQ